MKEKTFDLLKYVNLLEKKYKIIEDRMPLALNTKEELIKRECNGNGLNISKKGIKRILCYITQAPKYNRRTLQMRYRFDLDGKRAEKITEAEKEFAKERSKKNQMTSNKKKKLAKEAREAKEKLNIVKSKKTFKNKTEVVVKKKKFAFK